MDLNDGYFYIIYLFVCSKCQKYSPTESNKAYDKVANRRGAVSFDPQQVVSMVKQVAISGRRLLLPKDESIKQYLEVRRETYYILPQHHLFSVLSFVLYMEVLISQGHFLMLCCAVQTFDG